MSAYDCDCKRRPARRTPRHVAVVVLAVCVTTAAAADSAVRRRVVQAAERHARAALMEQVYAEQLSPTLTVGSLVTAHPAVGAELASWVASVGPATPPRWGEDAACEVTVQVAVQWLLARLRDACGDHDVAELPAERWEALIDAAGRRVLRATSVASAPAGGAPDPSRLPSIWRRYADADGRVRAAEAARADAARTLVRQFERHTIANGVTGGDLLGETPAVREAFEAFCARAPAIGRPTYRDDALIVEVRLELTAAAVGRWLTAHAPAPATGDEAAAGALRALAEATDTLFAAAGNGVPPEHLAAVASAPARPVVDAAPPWPPVLQAAGQAAPDGASAQAKLRAMRRAEAIARAALARRVAALEVAPSATVGSLAEAHGELHEAVGVCVAAARVLRSPWTADGRAEVIVELPTGPLGRAVAVWRCRAAVRRTATRPAYPAGTSGAAGTAGGNDRSQSGRMGRSAPPTAAPGR